MLAKQPAKCYNQIANIDTATAVLYQAKTSPSKDWKVPDVVSLVASSTCDYISNVLRCIKFGITYNLSDTSNASL
jgi:hypothetical protein